MSGKDRWGHTYLYEDGTRSGKPQREDKKLLLSYHYVENDSWTFMNSGPNRQISLFVNNSIKPSKLMKIIEKSKLGQGEKKELRKLYGQGNLKTGLHKDED